MLKLFAVMVVAIIFERNDDDDDFQLTPGPNISNSYPQFECFQ